MIRKLTVMLAAGAMAAGSTAAAAAAPERPLSPLQVRTHTVGSDQSDILPSSPLFLIAVTLGTLAVLEATGAIDIFHDDDQPDSP